MARFLCSTVLGGTRQKILGILGALAVVSTLAPGGVLGQQRGSAITVQARVLDRQLVWDGPNNIEAVLGSLRSGDTSTTRWESQLVTVQWEGAGAPRLALAQHPHHPDPRRRDQDHSPLTPSQASPVVRTGRVLEGVLSVQYLRN